MQGQWMVVQRNRVTHEALSIESYATRDEANQAARELCELFAPDDETQPVVGIYPSFLNVVK